MTSTEDEKRNQKGPGFYLRVFSFPLVLVVAVFSYLSAVLAHRVMVQPEVTHLCEGDYKGRWFKD